MFQNAYNMENVLNVAKSTNHIGSWKHFQISQKI